ncbi:MAG TPA: alpha/beta hydrolase [Dermatophilaceae bacterium]|nr:alpha/beta hydrolase [Dermatophilaceae bacterium]
MNLRRRTLTGIGIGLAAAGTTAAAKIVADRLARALQTAKELDSLDTYEEEASAQIVVLADDGVPLHVEVDEPDVRPAGLAKDAPVPTVVFCHGYCLSLRSWVFQRRALRAAGYRVVLWDQRGHGLSGAGSTESYEIDQLGLDLHAVITAVAPFGPLVLVGHSMGGMTLMSLAAHHPDLIRDRVIGVAFVATSPGGISAVSWGLGKVLGKAVHRLGPFAVGQLAGRQGLVNSVRKAGREVEEYFVDLYSFASPVPLSIVRLTADMIFKTRMEVISDFMETFDKHDKREALEQFSGVETLVINGVQDMLTPPEHSEEIVKLIPGAEHVLVNDAGHVIMLEHGDVVSEQLLALIGRAERAAAVHLDQRDKPRVRRTITDLAKRRRMKALEGRRRSAS